jgi:hypothetical protein
MQRRSALTAFRPWSGLRLTTALCGSARSAAPFPAPAAPRFAVTVQSRHRTGAVFQERGCGRHGDGSRYGMFRLSPELKAKGERAESAFRSWLNESGVAFLYIEQSPLNVPDAQRGRLKRPDYLVGVPFTGMMAFDVKAKTAYDGKLLFEVGEVDKLARFADFFHLTVHFACLDLDRPEQIHWVPLRGLIGRTPERRGRARVLAYPLDEAFMVSLDEPFLEASRRLWEQCLG